MLIPSDSLLFPELFDVFAPWQVPVITAVIYGLSVTLLNPTRSKSKSVASTASSSNSNKSLASKFFDALVLLHNIALCIFSAVTFVNLVPDVVANFAARGLKDAWCDAGEKLWFSSLGYWTWLFYLSKYYEIMDTVIILAKGKPSSLLQTYHHIGAIICMHVNFYYRATPVWAFVCFNSFIHTLMYFYFSLTTLDIRPPLFLKKSLTKLQIAQFLTGMTLALTYFAIEATAGNCLQNDGTSTAILINLAYLVPLTMLFIQFMIKSYYAKAKGQKSKKRVDEKYSELKEE